MKIKNTKKEYTNGEVTIVWQPSLCIHSENCWRGLPEVFRYKQKPWVDPQGADTSTIKAQIDKCPSGALSYYMNADGDKASVTGGGLEIDVIDNGPLRITGKMSIQYKGETIDKEKASLCRCGASENKPFCDGSHKKIGFEG